MKGGITMEQILKTEVQNRLTELGEKKQQVEVLKKQIEEKRKEISDFKEEWRNSCNHAFYRIQWFGFSEWITKGYYCCLCGKYESIEQTSPIVGGHTRYNRRVRHYSHNINRRDDYRPREIMPLPTKQVSEIHPYIGTVKMSMYKDSSSTESEEERYPVPPEFQAEVQLKNDELHKLEQEENSLEEKLQELEKNINLSRTELDSIAHSLNSYFGYPEVVIQAPHRWTRDDFNYDPFD